jgi:hypothetical protein
VYDSAADACSDPLTEGTPGNLALARLNARKTIIRGAWHFGAWVSFLAILGLFYVSDEDRFWRWTNSLTHGDFGKPGLGIVLIVVMLIAFPPFISASMLMTGCFELATGRPFQQIETWFGGLNWRRKCLVVPVLAAPLAIVSYGLIRLGAILVSYYVKR